MMNKEELINWIDRPPSNTDLDLINYIIGLQEKVEYLKSKIENKDRWCQLIADIGYDYDGYRKAEDLMTLIDDLVEYALNSRDNYDFEILGGKE